MTFPSTIDSSPVQIPMKLIVILTTYFRLVHPDRPLENVNRKLSEEEQNAVCCAQHLSCCTKAQEPTNFEVRALLLKCPPQEETASPKNLPPTTVKKKRTPKREVSDERYTGSQQNKQSEITNCKRKIKLTIKITNSHITNCKNQYIIIDHVFDSVTNQKQKLLSPYVLKIKQEPVMQTYELVHDSLVNSEAKEKIHNKKEPGYTGCSVNPSRNPTCGAMRYKNEVIPYSTGFCCSCDENNSNFHQGTMSRNGSVSAGLSDSSKVMFPPYGFSRQSKTVHNVDDFNRNSLESTNEENHNVQKRGGQDCNDKYTPPDADPNTYHDSAHCLEFSDLWYNVYQLEKPKLRHSLALQIYQKYQDYGSNCKWRELTKMVPIIVGDASGVANFNNDQGTIIVNYKAQEISDNLFSLRYKSQKLLIPDTSNIGADLDRVPELKGGPAEYLVVTDTRVEPNGKLCNTVGVGYEAFAKQPNRCSVSRGSCLENQPSQMWRHDHELDANGKRGKYFLKNFGVLPDSPIVRNGSSENKTLAMYFTECFTSSLEVEIKADHNTVLRPGSLAMITEAYVDSSGPDKTSIVAKVFNTGLVSGVFSVDLTDCPLELPASFGNIHSKPALIPPQHQHIYKLDILCPLPLTDFFCSLQARNDKQELIALRKIRLQRQDRCVCVWHCSCACLLADRGLRCSPLSLEAYYAAGFQGGMPQSLHVVQYTLTDDLVSMMLYIIMFLCLTLLLMGLCKALVGVVWVPMGLWGLDVILDLPKRMNKYYETDIDHREVLCDENGWPVHPDTRKRVRNIPLQAEFCINVIFFMVYPLALIWSMIRKNKPVEGSDEVLCYCRNGDMVQRRSSGLQNSLVKKSSVLSLTKPK